MRLFTTFLIILARAFPPRIKVKTHFMERGSRVNHRRVNLNRTKRNLKLATTKIVCTLLCCDHTAEQSWAAFTFW